MQFTQEALFPDSEIVGTGQPAPWPLAQDHEQPDTQPAQAETLPFDEEWAA